MQQYFKIGDIAEAKGFSINALRYYDRIGLIKPAYVDPETGYRYYGSQQLYKLEIIKFLKSMGVKNEDLLRLCEDNDIEEWDAFLLSLSRELRERIDMLIQSISRLDSMRSRISYLRAVNEYEGIYYRHFDARYVLVRECHSLPTKDETIANFTALYKEAAKYGLDNTFQSGAILSCSGELESLNYESVYIEVSGSPALAGAQGCTVLPAGLYICINNTITNAAERSEILLDYVRSSGIKPRIITEEYVFTDFVGYCDPHMALQILAE